MIWKSLIFTLSMFSLIPESSGKDQITIVPFSVIFPFIPSDHVYELTDQVNSQNTTEEAIEVLNVWLDRYWTTPVTSTTMKPSKTQNATSSKYYYGRLVEKEFARNMSISFLEHREAVRSYVRFMFRNTQILNYFNEKQAIQMRNEFWKTDKYCYNDFDCTERQFLFETSEKYAKIHKNITSDLTILTSVVHKFPGVGEKLNWVFKRD